MLFNQFPYTDAHELNLDWIIKKIIELGHAFDDFEAVNKITNAGAWDITKQYQPWTIVSDNNIGYISLKPVPAGVAITNIEYWGVIADYDILITDLSNRISTLEGQMTTLNNTTIPGIQSNINDINDEIDLLKNRRFIFIADSYAGTSQWWSKLNNILRLTANSNSFCNAVGGEGFTKGGLNNDGFLYELQQHKATITDTYTITDIFVVGGANDAEMTQDYNTNTIEQAMIDFVSYANTNFPNAKIHVGFIGKCHYDSSTLENRTQHNLEVMLYRYAENALKYGCAFINDLQYSTRWLGKVTTRPDGLHPTPAGGDIIARSLANYILGSVANTMLEDYTLNTSNVITGGTWNMSFTMNNGNASITLGELAGSVTGTLYGGDENTTTRTTLAYFDGIFVNKEIHAKTWLYVQGSSPYAFMADIRILGNEISLVIMTATNNGWSQIDLSNKVIVMGGVTFNFDSFNLG